MTREAFITRAHAISGVEKEEARGESGHVSFDLLWSLCSVCVCVCVYECVRVCVCMCLCLCLLDRFDSFSSQASRVFDLNRLTCHTSSFLCQVLDVEENVEENVEEKVEKPIERVPVSPASPTAISKVSKPKPAVVPRAPTPNLVTPAVVSMAVVSTVAATAYASQPYQSSQNQVSCFITKTIAATTTNTHHHLPS